MKNLMKRSGMALAACCVFLSGCGTNLTILTPQEENLIVAYSSGAVARHNKSQQKGLVVLPVVEEDSVQEEEKEQIEQDAVLKPSVSQGQAGTEKTEAAEEISLTKAVNISSIEASYQKYDVTERYVEGDYFVLTADEGMEFLVLQIDLKNTSQKSVDCSILSRNMKAVLNINGKQKASALTTILLSDFLTYDNTIKASETVQTVLLFQVEKGVEKNISTLSLELQENGKTSLVVLK